MALSDPALGGLVGVGLVLVVGFAASRSSARAQQRRLELIRQKIERRQAQLADASQPDDAGESSELSEERVDD